MKRFIIKIILFFSIILVIDFSFGRICGIMIAHANSGETKEIRSLCEGEKNDIIIMGSSKAHHDYISQIISDSLNVKCYNAGQDGNGIILSYGILNMMNSRNYPKLVIYDVKQQFDLYRYSGDGDYTRYIKLLRPFFGNKEADDIISSISNWELIKLKSSLYRYNGQLISMVLNLRNNANDNNMGYQPLEGYIENGLPQERDYILEIDPIKYKYLNDFIDFTKDKGIQLVIVLSPEYNTPLNNDFEPIRVICESKGITLLDYFDNPIFQNKDLFKDHCHLNPNGAKVFTEKLVSNLKTVGNK